MARIFACSLLLLISLAVASTDAQCATTRTKVMSLLTKLFNGPSVDTAVKLLINKGLAPNLPLNVTCQREYQCYKNGGGDACIINQLMKGVPPMLYMRLITVYNKFNTCLKNGGTNLDAIVQKVGPTLIYKLNAPYNLCRNKYSTMKRNRIAPYMIENKVCEVANSGFTKWLIQACITAAKQKINKWAHWKCIKEAAPAIMNDQNVCTLYTW